jgi:hypothetical protein
LKLIADGDRVGGKPGDASKTTWLDRQKLASMTQEIDLSGVPAAAAILAGQVRGRIVVKIG